MPAFLLIISICLHTFFNVLQGMNPYCIKVYAGHNLSSSPSPVYYAVIKNNQLYTAGHDNSSHIINISKLKQNGKESEDSQLIEALHNLLIENRIQIEPKIKNIIPKKVQKFESAIFSIAQCPHEKYSSYIAYALSNGDLIIWDSKKDEQVTKFSHHKNAVFSVAWDPHTKGLLACSLQNGAIELIDLETKRIVHTFAKHKSTVYEIVFHPAEKKLASVSWDKTLRIWDTEKWTNKALKTGLTPK